MNKREFYEECARLLGTTHEYSTLNDVLRLSMRTGRRRETNAGRWSGREPGNGRFAGCGLIRAYGPEAIHVCLTSPIAANAVLGSYEEAIVFLKQALSSKAGA